MVDYDKYLVIDLETSIKNRGEDAVGTNKASPFFDDNQIVMTGLKGFSDDEVEICLTLITVGSYKVLVGHNIKFDLLYMYKYSPRVKEAIDSGFATVWDTQLVQYLLEGQTKTFPSLDYTAEKYGGTLKDDRIKAFWEENIDTEEIPEDMLEEYLKEDVRNTELVYLAQLKEVKRRGMMPLVESQMQALLATTEMEWNGMYFDREIAATEMLRLIDEMSVLERETIATMSTVIDPKIVEINPYSNDQLSVAMFGGSLPYKEELEELDEYSQPVRFKSGARKGQIKTKKIDLFYTTPGFSFNKTATTPLKKKGFYATNDKVLKKLSTIHRGANDFITMLLDLRRVKKDLTTYYQGYSNLVWPDGRIHGSIHHCSTVTGRLSSSQPNLQNLTSTGD